MTMESDDIVTTTSEEPIEDLDSPDKIIEEEDDEEINGVIDVEPGELPTANESGGDGVVNVLEDILGEDAGHDDLQKELDDDTASKKEGDQKGKKAPKQTTRRKSARKKSPSKSGKPEASTNSPKQNESKATTEGLTPPVKTKSVKADAVDKKVEKTSPEIPSGSSKPEKAEKVKPGSSSKSAGVEKSETTPLKNSKPTSKKPKSVEKVKKDEGVKSVDEKEALVKKVKELEKMVVSKPTTVDAPSTSSSASTSTAAVVVVEGEKPRKEKSSSSKVPSSAERKRTHSHSSKETKETKGKKVKSKEVKSKEKKEKKTDDGDKGIKEEPVSDHEDDDMKVVDAVDETQSEHGSHASNESEFSNTFSRSPSFTGSFEGSFSGSLSLSSFTASNTSLDSLDKKILAKKKKRAKVKKEGGDGAGGGGAGVEGSEEHKEFIDSLLKGARYFIVKSNNHENVTLSKAKGVWATPPANERKLNDAYRHSTNVILIYSVKESGRFQGFARLASESRHDGIPVPWVLPPGFDRRILGGTFKVDWLNRKEVPFSQCTNLRNPWNENKEVKICRDGQELEPSVGEVLCRMFEEDYLIDLSHVSRHVRHRKRLGEYYPKRDRFRGGRSNWRGGHRGDFGGGYHRGGGDRFGGRRGGGSGGFFRRDQQGGARGGRFVDRNNRPPPPPREFNRFERQERQERFSPPRSRSRSPRDYSSVDRETRDRRHKDKVKEFLKNDRTKFGVRKETLLHGSYTDYVREFQRQKQMRFDPKLAAEEFLRRSSSRR